MQISITGINHRTAPLCEREKASVSSEGLQLALDELRSYSPHAVILSTCNRTEVYTAGTARGSREPGAAFLQKRLGLSADAKPPYFYTVGGDELFRHLCGVACGLDSLAIGEHEVLGQVRHALAASEKAGMVNLPLRHVFHSAIRTGRRAREETGIARNALSISSIAVNKALDIVTNITSSRVVIVGAGEAGRLSLNVARARGASDVTVISRTIERAVRLASQLDARAASHDQLLPELKDADIVITCAASPHFVLRRSQVEAVMRGRASHPLIMLDIAMPRNVEPGTCNVPGVHLFDIDDLNQDAESHRQDRETEVAAVEKIIAQEAALLARWWRAYNARPVIKQVVDKAEKIRSYQYARAMAKLGELNEKDRQEVDLLTRSIVDKILRGPIMFLKSGDAGQNAELISRVFGLDEGGKE
jgi:glutamyl-tRNA reductase